jgi:tRNA (mo5U34)-methyltransferase
VTRLNKSVYDLDPAAEGKFDVVLCGALLEHLQNPVRALERMREVCRGELLLIEQVSPRLDLFARKMPSARFGQNVDEWWTVNSAGLVQLATTAGFEVTWVSKHFLLPPGPAAPSSWKFSRLGAVMARRPFAKGLLFRALRGRPREPNPSR